jgi:hypothetical protein
VKKLVANNTSSILYCRSDGGQILDAGEMAHDLQKPTKEDVDNHLANGVFTLRRPGSYRPVIGLCALPPYSSWLIAKDGYEFVSDLRASRGRASSVSDVLNYAKRLLAKAGPNKRIGVELSGGLDSSIIIEFLLSQSVPVSLVAFTSSRYEFRTERAIQSHYQKLSKSVHLIPYEECLAFSGLEKVPPHPFPVQESLYFSRHLAAAKACRLLGVDILLSGEAGDQLLGLAPEACDNLGRAPKGFAYWNLAELWSHQYVHIPQGTNYISGMALGRLPAMILQARSGLAADHMKLWARRELSNYLPTILSNYAYKAFHDGWVIDGLQAACPAIFRMSNCAYEITHHPELKPGLMIDTAKHFRLLDHQQRAYFFTKLAFVTWVFSNHRSEN